MLGNFLDGYGHGWDSPVHKQGRVHLECVPSPGAGGPRQFHRLMTKTVGGNGSSGKLAGALVGHSKMIQTGY
jgi:hypothetical protein